MKYIIHRGITSDKIKENTYESIKKAIKSNNTVGVEFDIRLTKDRKVVLSHNSLIDFTPIENLNYLDIIKKQYLTTLDKVLTINTDKIFLIDIKVNKNYKRFADELLYYINNINRNIYLCSFNKRIIKYLRKKTKYKSGRILLFYKKFHGAFIMINYRSFLRYKHLNLNNKEIFLWTIPNMDELDNIKKKMPNINDFYLIIDRSE